MSRPLNMQVARLLVALSCLFAATVRAQTAVDPDAGAVAVDDAAVVQGDAEPAAVPASHPPVSEQPAPESASELDPQQAAFEAGLLEASLASEPQPSYPRLSLYGFADFTYSKYFMPSGGLLSLYIANSGSFSVGNANLYVDSQVSSRLRSLLEIRFSFLPNGALSVDSATGQIVRQSTQVTDYRIIGRNSQWGSIGIERVVVSYDLLPWLTLSAGRFITPWGLWNIDHGTPTLINIVTPLAIDSQFIPTRQTGLQANGAWAFPSWRVGYYLTLSNGRGPVDAYRDFDENKAVGGRAFVSSTALLGELTLGFTFYFGRETDPKLQYIRVPADGSRAYIDTVRKVSSRERALAADLKWEWKGYLLMSEFVATGRTYDDDHRGFFDTSQSALASDGRQQITSDSLRYGGYLTVGHRFAWLGTMPFANVEYSYSSEQPISPKLITSQLGLNVRPEPGLVLKLLGSIVYLKDSAPLFLGKDAKVFAVHTQIAWAF